MKKFDQWLIVIALILVLVLIISINMITLFLKLIAAIALMAFVLYWKLTPYKAHLQGKYIKHFATAERVFSPILRLFHNLPKVAVGRGVSLDMAPVAVCAILILLIFIL